MPSSTRAFAVAVATIAAWASIAPPACVAAVHAAAPRERWDPRIVEYVRFVERERGARFDHPIPVRFLEDAEFQAALSGTGDVTDEDRELAKLAASDLVALGLADHPVDLLELAASDETTLGFYDTEREEMVVRGTDLDDVEVRVTLVHELVHALQDQRFDLDALDETIDTDGEDFAVAAVVEGDATYVENEFLRALPRAEQRAYYEHGDRVGGDDDAASTPLVLDLFGVAPYDFGPFAIDVALDDGGRQAVNRLFRSPPRSEELIVDPVAFLRDDGPVTMDLTAFAADERPQGEPDEWGALSWYMTLASRIDWREALRASEGWGGDRYQSFVRAGPTGDQPCVRIAVTGDTPRDTDELADAIGKYVDELPAGGAIVARDGERVVLSACVVGGVGAPDDEQLQDAYDRLWERNDQLVQAIAADVSPRLSRCIADRIVADATARTLLYSRVERSRAEDRTLSRRFERAAAHCR